ncbi:hypothetical protein HGA64_00545 [Candidatus Falkowbacteria bacterium]|nr:hypothetical protein [Candidatus Falkowbacteria bacterium]
MNKFRKVLSITAIISLVAVNGLVNTATAASLTSVKNTLSNSDKSVVATSTFSMITHTPLVNGNVIQITYPAAFGNITDANSITCPVGTTKSILDTENVLCTVGVGGLATGTWSVVVGNVTNPAAVGSQTFNVTTRTVSNGTIVEQASTMVAIIDNVDVSASVAATLTFVISDLAAGQNVNGQVMSTSSATTTMAFGTLPVGSPVSMGQALRVTTNADDGFTVTVEQNQNLTSNANSDIDSFMNGTTSAPQLWGNPANTLDAEWTYGHFGFTSEDSTLSAGDTYGNNLWRGFATSTPYEVMWHNGPADGTSTDKGYTEVGYQIQIGSLQEAGDYYNTLTYIATPSF